MQVTFLASEWGSSKGGLSTINRELAIQLARCSGAEITFFVLQCSEQDKKEALSHNINIIEARRRPGYDELEWLSFPPEHLKIDIIVGHGVKLGHQAQVIRDTHKCRWIQVVHTDPEELGMFKSYVNPISTGEVKHNIEVELCEMADFVVGVGPKLSEAFRSYLRWCEKDQTILDLTPGVFDEFVSVKQAPVERKNSKVLVFGRGDAKDFALKGFDIAGKAVASLPDTSLVFVGAPDGKHEQVRARLLECGISTTRLKVRGYINSRKGLKRLFSEVDLALMPSRTEGFGLTGLEALSAGLPVLVSKNSGFGEALSKVTLGESSVIDSEDPQIWAAAITKMWNRERLSRLEEAKALRTSYDNKYSWAKQRNDLFDKMTSLIHGSTMASHSSSAERPRSTHIPAALDLARCAFTKSTRIFVQNLRSLTTKSICGWIFLLFLMGRFRCLNHHSYDEACPTENADVPFSTKEFNVTRNLNDAREGFIGRHWLYRDLESLFLNSKVNSVRGAVVIGEPGAGKSALIAQLICSRSSNAYIHERIIGYHLCKYYDKATQDPGRFVRNLVDLIARRIPEFGMLISNTPSILEILQQSCFREPYYCFEQAIATPLQTLNYNQQHYFMIVDALDECSSDDAEISIAKFIKDTYKKLPKWIHLVMTSRNDSSVLRHFSSFPKLYLSSKDARNLQDIEIFTATKLLENAGYLERLKVMLGFGDTEVTSYVTKTLVSQSQGNFLFTKETLHFWKDGQRGDDDLNQLPKAIDEQYESYSKRKRLNGMLDFRSTKVTSCITKKLVGQTQHMICFTREIFRVNLNQLPKTIEEQYESYLKRTYGSREKFKPALAVLEVLVAAFEPLKINDVFEVLRISERIDYSYEYDFVYNLQRLSHYVTYGEDNTVTLYHQSFKEWLTSSENLGRPYYVSRGRGHRRLAEYYLSVVRKTPNNTKDFSGLAMHFSRSDQQSDRLLEEFKTINELRVNATIYYRNRTPHLAAVRNDIKFSSYLVRHFITLIAAICLVTQVCFLGYLLRFVVLVQTSSSS